MSHTASKPTAAVMLNEAQNYRTSLESLMSVGRALLSGPSMEDASATAFQVLAENVLEQADHQQDLVAVDGVEEPQVRVELIMQDVLTPRLTEVEQIEDALQAKADAEEPVAFHTSERATRASQEDLILSMEMLAIHRNYIGAIRSALSMESFPVAAAAPLLQSVTRCFGSYADKLGVSMESLEQTQVLGEMSDAVDRIEQLVTKAHESVLEHAEAIRADARAVGSDEADKLGDLIEKHRQDNPVGIQFEEGTSVNSIQSDAEPKDDEEQEETLDESESDGEQNDAMDDTSMTDDEMELVPNEDDQEQEEEAPLEEDPDLEEASEEEEETDLDDEQEEELPEEVEEVELPEEEEELPEEEEEGDDLDNDEEEVANADTIDEDAIETEVEEEEEPESEEQEEEEETAEEEDDDLEEEEEEDGETNSNESLVEPMVWDADVYGEQAAEVRGIHTQILRFLGDHGMLTPEGQAIAENDQAVDFVFSTDLMTPHAAEVLARHYQTWIGASLRDGQANLLSLGILLGV